jgi:AcrR family transcriptional regulator
MSGAVKRQYDSTRRQEQAAETRQRIIQAAHDQFVGKGYGSTTIADVARAAGVAVETVYAAFRNKHTLLRQVWYVSFRGDEEDVRLWDRPEIRTVIAEPDLAQRFNDQAVILTAVFRRITPLLLMLQGAIASQPAAAAMLAEFDERRLDAARKYARAAAATDQLAVSEDDCRDVLWATLDGVLWHRLVAERGWSDERFAAWLGQLWTSTLVKAQNGTTGSVHRIDQTPRTD